MDSTLTTAAKAERDERQEDKIYYLYRYILIECEERLKKLEEHAFDDNSEDANYLNKSAATEINNQLSLKSSKTQNA